MIILNSTGFSEGWIKWDDEDTKNSNLASGRRPDGTYREDTLLYFCCRSDGSADTPIELPIRLPFFLLKHASKCQAVMGMRVIEEWLFWDCEDKENKNRWSGELPESLLAKDIKLFFCYYFQMWTTCQCGSTTKKLGCLALDAPYVLPWMMMMLIYFI
ncbi:hypothetical protein P5673_033110 [Acropora cervicornis]|uniref:Apextrin C-terminal domain-containing protein n=1 Tax=Acropora cervicornis TaxID=6130 RepID=A0AAD9PQQ0_ACRCE|nr:hypothetical protein P5673_033110 [Acropora cervicornis]